MLIEENKSSSQRHSRQDLNDSYEEQFEQLDQQPQVEEELSKAGKSKIYKNQLMNMIQAQTEKIQNLERDLEAKKQRKALQKSRSKPPLVDSGSSRKYQEDRQVSTHRRHFRQQSQLILSQPSQREDIIQNMTEKVIIATGHFSNRGQKQVQESQEEDVITDSQIQTARSLYRNDQIKRSVSQSKMSSARTKSSISRNNIIQTQE